MNPPVDGRQDGDVGFLRAQQELTHERTHHSSRADRIGSKWQRPPRQAPGIRLRTLPDRAVADSLEDRRRRAESEWGCARCRHCRDFWTRHDPDLVVNASPNRQHVPVSSEMNKT